MRKTPVLFSGSSHRALAEDVAKRMGFTLSPVHLFSFPDHEMGCRLEEDVRGKEVFIVQSCVYRPNHFLHELYLLIDAAKRAGAKEIIPVLPYFPYCRQDRRVEKGEPISARVVAECLEAVGATKLIACDLHQGQLEGFFNIPVLHLSARGVLVQALEKYGLNNPMFVAPDVGSGKISRDFAKQFGAEFALTDKHRHRDGGITMHLIGSVKEREVVIVDDLSSTGKTLCLSGKICQAEGASKLLAALTHPIFVEEAIERLLSSNFEKIFVTDTIPLTEKAKCLPMLEVVSVAEELAQGILQVVEE